MQPAPATPADLARRRLAAALLLSLLVHALLLSIGFGLPDLAPGSRAPLTVTIAPEPALAPVPAATPTATPAATPAPAPAPATSSAPVLNKAQPDLGMTLVDPVAPPAPPVPAPAPRTRKQVAPRRISRPRAPAAAEEQRLRVIAQEQNPDARFVLPLPELAGVGAPAEPLPAKAGAGEQAGDLGAPDDAAQQAGTGQAALAAAPERADQEAQQRVAEERRVAAETAQRQAAALAQLQQYEDAAQRKAAQAQASRLAQQLADEQSGLLRQRQADQDAVRHQAEEAERQRAAQIAQQQVEQLAAARQVEEISRQHAEQGALQRQAEEAARRQADELARQQAFQLAARQRADEAAQQQAELAARQRADQLAREQAEQAERERGAAAARRLAEGAPGAAAGGAGAGVLADSGRPGAGAGSGTGSVAIPKHMLGSDIGNRARDMLRGIDVLRPLPPAARPAEDALRARRRGDADAARRDVPLRMYVDSFRQKIERNGAMAGISLAADQVRIDPLVSVTLRSDGSVDEVTIVRSSGRPETDEAVRRLVRLNARYSAFPPNVAALYDVVEIRRIWRFDAGLKLREEVR